MRHWKFAPLVLIPMAARAAAPAAQPGALFGINMNNGQSLSVPMQIVILMTLLTLLPALFMAVTPFLRIAIVLHFLRQALGTRSSAHARCLPGIRDADR